MKQRSLYENTSWNPFAADVRLTPHELRVGRWRVPVAELHLLAMADAYVRGFWLGGGGREVPLARIPAERGVVPVTRNSGSTRPVRVRAAAAFTDALGRFAVEACGGSNQVRAEAAHAEHVGVPLWIARRHAMTPAGPVTVAVDRKSVRADVWMQQGPIVRLRPAQRPAPGRRLTENDLVLTVDSEQAALTLRKSRRPKWRSGSVTLHLRGRTWVLRRSTRQASELLRDGTVLARLQAPTGPTEPGQLRPLATAHFLSPHDLHPLDAMLTHMLAVAFALGDATGTSRFVGEAAESSDEQVWLAPWHTGVGNSPDDVGPGVGGDGWSGGDGGGLGGDGGSGGGDGGGGGGGE